MQNIKLSGRNLNLILIAGITVLLIITLSMSGCTGPKVDGNQNVTNGNGNESTGGTQNQPAEVVETGDSIEVNYVGKFENGTVFDESKGEPLKFTVGAGNMIKGFDEAVVGMKAGEKKNVKILPGNAYGMPESMPRTQNLTYDQFVQAVGKEPVLNMVLNVQEIYWPMTVIKIDNVTGENVTITIRHDPTPNTEYTPRLKVFKVSENEMEIGHSLSGEALVFDITIVNIKKTNVKYISDLSPQGGFTTFESDDPTAPICADGKKPVVYMFSTTGCPHCIWVKETFDKVAKEYVASGRITAYHWELDTGDNTLTPEIEASVPESEQTIFRKFSPGGGVPTFVFGCKYYRLGTGYEPQNDLASEEKEFRELIEQMIKSSESA
jgi:FKBP-type peptidyl-prolyl cis-trans isomerase 2/glutaredoxin